ncbi:hypothetical protein LB507_011496, partial [Fusarium sp. FIESC RH6]
LTNARKYYLNSCLPFCNYWWIDNTNDPALANRYILSRIYGTEFQTPSTFSNANEAAKVKTGITTPTPRAAGEIANCISWFDHYREAGCEELLLTYDLYFDELYEMNPSVNADCSGLVLGMNYCQSTYPGGRQVGIPGWHNDDEDDDEIDPESYRKLEGLT